MDADPSGAHASSVAAPPRPSSVTAKPVSAGGGAPALPTSPAPPKVYSQPEVYKLVSSKTCICGRPHLIDTCGFLLRAGIYLEINEVKATKKLCSLHANSFSHHNFPTPSLGTSSPGLGNGSVRTQSSHWPRNGSVRTLQNRYQPRISVSLPGYQWPPPPSLFQCDCGLRCH